MYSLFSREGLLRVIDSDNDSGFVVSAVKEVCTLVDIDQKFHIAYHPRAAGQVERMNRTIKTELMKGLNIIGSNWDKILLLFLMSI